MNCCTEDKKYFYFPTQVKFLDTFREERVFWHYGIAYHDEIICGCCGGIFNLNEFWEEFAALKEEEEIFKDIEEPIEILLGWADLEDIIKG